MGSSSSLQGYRVVNVLPNSPLEHGNLQSYVDFIVSANGVRLNTDQKLATIIAKSINCPIVLKVISLLTRRSREETVVPHEWGGAGLLGGTVRFEEWSPDEELGVRVLGLIPGSPAEGAGLNPLDDYILGTEDDTVLSSDHLVSLALKAKDSLTLYVFSVKDRKVRTVEVRFPEGAKQIGIDAGQGALHALENVLSKPPLKASENKANPFTQDPAEIVSQQQSSVKPLNAPENAATELPRTTQSQGDLPQSLSQHPKSPEPQLSKPAEPLQPKTAEHQEPAGPQNLKAAEHQEPKPAELQQPKHSEPQQKPAEPQLPKPAEPQQKPAADPALERKAAIEETKQPPKTRVPPPYTRPRVEFVPPKLPKDLPILKNPFQPS